MACSILSGLASLAEDGLVDALMMEVASLLERLIEHGEAGCIDLRGMPLSASGLSSLEAKLGRGEITIQVATAGLSKIHETSFPGVWWTRHEDEAGRVIALLLEVALVPGIISADLADMAAGLSRLPGQTNFSIHNRAGLT
jgi:hydrogenase-1 operon protein HyaF